MIDPTLAHFFGDYPVTTTYGAPVATGAEAGTPHMAVDIGLPFGTPVKAPTGGKVIAEPNDVVGGEQLVVETPQGYDETFAHLSLLSVAVGDTVAPGEVIASSGSSGEVTGPHLHFGVTDPSGKPVDPTAFLGSGTPKPPYKNPFDPFSGSKPPKNPFDPFSNPKAPPGTTATPGRGIFSDVADAINNATTAASHGLVAIAVLGVAAVLAYSGIRKTLG
ncbi:MAG: M23 family metallopeptidase [Chloroflexota bacterium]|nr:M23 family metallopeptidase [Chloroflexota bacterium]